MRALLLMPSGIVTYGITQFQKTLYLRVAIVGRLLLMAEGWQIVWPGQSKSLCQCSCGKQHYFVNSKAKRAVGSYCRECLKAGKAFWKDLTGIKFGLLTPVKNLGKSIWLCKCDCGNEINVRNGTLKSNKVISCGCVNMSKRVERIKEMNKTDLTFTHIKIIASKRDKALSSGRYFGIKTDSNKFVAKISGKVIGRFNTPIEAAKAYDKASFEKYSEPSILNFPEDYN